MIEYRTDPATSAEILAVVNGVKARSSERLASVAEILANADGSSLGSASPVSRAPSKRSHAENNSGRCRSPWPSFYELPPGSRLSLTCQRSCRPRGLTIRDGPVIMQYPAVNGMKAFEQQCFNVKDAIADFSLRREHKRYLEVVV
jgi:hypothetical protein